MCPVANTLHLYFYFMSLILTRKCVIIFFCHHIFFIILFTYLSCYRSFFLSFSPFFLLVRLSLKQVFLVSFSDEEMLHFLLFLVIFFILYILRYILLQMAEKVHRQKILRYNVLGDKTSWGRTTWDKTYCGQNVLWAKGPEGQNILRDKTSSGTKLPWD